MNWEEAWYGRRLALISPHPDDVAYSSGGLVARLAGRCELHLVTVFTHSAWAAPKALRSAGSAAISAMRYVEDKAFCDRFGLRLSSLGLADSSLSGYDDESELAASAERDPRAPVAARALRALLAELAPDGILAPAAVGGHVDHRIVRDALLTRSHGVASLAFYEDLPYAAGCELERLDAQLRAQGLRPAANVDIDSTLGEKLAAMWIYDSQTEQDTVDEIVSHARRLAAWSGCTAGRQARQPAGASAGKSVFGHVERIWE